MSVNKHYAHVIQGKPNNQHAPQVALLLRKSWCKKCGCDPNDHTCIHMHISPYISCLVCICIHSTIVRSFYNTKTRISSLYSVFLKNFSSCDEDFFFQLWFRSRLCVYTVSKSKKTKSRVHWWSIILVRIG